MHVEELQESTRCGRCAEILPDETLTYCPMCGIPFSQVPPTNTFTHLGSRNLLRHLRRQQFRVGFLAALLFLGFWSLIAAGYWWQQRRTIAELDPGQRRLQIYFWQSPEHPEIRAQAFHNSLSIALQAFQDHFSHQIPGYEVHMDRIPPQLNSFLSAALREDLKNPHPKLAPPTSRLSFWEQRVFPALTEQWSRNPRAPLPIFVTNIPIQNFPEDGTHIETLHLTEDGYISGLGHPALVVVSAYRALNEMRHPSEGRLAVHTDSDMARYLGEFLLAHELGHALLGLEDKVISSGRSPAAIEDTTLCLMHTDMGGGFEAWNQIRSRPLGEATPCRAYDSVLRSFENHRKGIEALKSGNKKAAREFLDSALRDVEGQAQPWVSKLWRKDRSLSSPLGLP
jgi:hypothetical protein